MAKAKKKRAKGSGLRASARSKKPARTKPKPKVTSKRTTHHAPRTTKPEGGSPKPTPKPALLGTVTAPSGRLALFDIGLVGFLPRDALAPLLVTIDVPRDRELAIVGRRVGSGRYADCWDHVAVRLGDGDIAHAKRIGDAAVDFARLAFMDPAALDAWQHEHSLDGKADFVFWGRDVVALGKAMNAPALPDGRGWLDLSVADAEAKADRAARLKAENRWLLAMDLRPHSHHYYALAAARGSAQGAGTIEVGGARVCLFFTSWGDGVFPVFLDLDDAGRPVQMRVQLNPTGPAARA